MTVMARRRQAGSRTALSAILALGACPSPPRTDQPPAAAEAPVARTDSGLGAPAGSGVALEGTEWRLVALAGAPVPPGEGRSHPGFRLVADGRKVQGNAGCNRMMGTYELDGTSLRFGPLASTKMACPAMETETKFLEALRATTRYELAGSNLTLFGADAPVARLEATTPPSPASP
jgi:copper homeostasis protein (lipoprotein)